MDIAKLKTVVYFFLCFPLLPLATFSFPEQAQQLKQATGENRAAARMPAADQMNEDFLLHGITYLAKDDTTHARPLFMRVINYYQGKNNLKRGAETWQRFGEHVNRSNKPLLDLHTFCYKQAEAHYRKAGYRLEAAKMLKEVGDDYLVGGRLDESEKTLLEVIKEFKALHYNKLHYTYDLLASLARLQGDQTKQLIYSLAVVRSMEATADTIKATDFYIGLASTYSSMKKSDKAIYYYQKALKFTHSENYMYQYYFTVMNLANLMIGNHDVPGALALLNKVSAASPPKIVDDKMFIDEGYGACYTALHQYSKAKPYYLDLVKLSDHAFKANAIAPLDYFVHTMIYMRLLLQDKQYYEAASYVQKLKKLPKIKLTPKSFIDFELVQYKIDSAFKNYLQAIRHYKNYTQLKDSIYNVSKTRQMDAIQYKFETEKKDQDLIFKTRSITDLNKRNMVQQQLVKQTRLVRNLVIVGLIMLLLLLGILYNRYRLKQRNNLLLQDQREEIDRQNQALQELNTKQQALLIEKEWLLREIHHRVKNNLQTSLSLLNMQSAQISNDEALNAIKDSQRRMQAMSLIHQKLYQSDSMTLIDMNSYIRDLMVYLAESFGNPEKISMELFAGPVKLDVSLAVPLGLIINEAVTNAMKYAFPGSRSGKVTICLEELARQLKVVIEDDGVGFNTDDYNPNTSSLGIKLMRGLTDQLQGEFTLQSGNGTRVGVVFNDVLDIVG